MPAIKTKNGGPETGNDSWSSDELNAIGSASELELAVSQDGDPVTIWVVRSGADFYVRSWRAEEGRWYRSARRHGQARVEAGGVVRDVALVPIEDEAINDAVDEAYRSKYGRYGSDYVGPMTRPEARATTLRLARRDPRR